MSVNMKNSLLEYLEYYKDYEYSSIHFNIVDATILGFLAYEPVYDIKDGSSLNELYEASLKLEDRDIHGAMAHITIQLLEQMKDSNRYKDIKVYGVTKTINSDVQFGAITFRCDDFTYVSYEGTSASMSGWVENFLLYSDYPTETQVMSIDYLKNVINDDDSVIYVGGHSKGGNLAMCASMETTKSIFNRIKTVYNLDGPGFREEEYNTDKFNKMHDKCINILPDGSMVGILLNNNDYNFVEAQDMGFKKHYPFNWKIFGEFFKKGEQSKYSIEIQKQLNTSTDKINIDDYRKLVEAFKDFFKENNLVTSHDLNELTFVKLKEMFDDVKDVDPETRKRFFEMIKLLFTR